MAQIAKASKGTAKKEAYQKKQEETKSTKCFDISITIRACASTFK